jgi:hypothetical protein
MLNVVMLSVANEPFMGVVALCNVAFINVIDKVTIS